MTQVKIDQSFVRNMISDANDVAIIRIILSLGETFGMDVIAEGVETETDYRFLVDLGCRSFQGYFFGRPQSADRLLAAPPNICDA